jgi:L-serine dehydratase
MESIREIFRIGHGPSSSHTMGPHKAAIIFKEKNSTAVRFEITLYGSLAATGRGHLTDVAILNVLGRERSKIIWEPETFLKRHSNGMTFVSFSDDNIKLDEETYYSIGGGKIVDDNFEVNENHIYKLSFMDDILRWCSETGKSIWNFVDETESSDIWDYLFEVWKVMQASIKAGVDAEGVLPGGLNLPRKANSYYIKAREYDGSMRRRSFVYAYALAVSEQNAAGDIVVTSPTCGSCGVVPAVLYYLKTQHGFEDKRILRGLATAGLFGNIVKTNASISGAEVGCQGEIGTACAMAAGALNQILGGSPSQVEYAAEIGMEHNLGLTCDPVEGLVQVPCIERNAFAASRAIDANAYVQLSDGTHKVSFDTVVKTMDETGRHLSCKYKETSTGGLAKYFSRH